MILYTLTNYESVLHHLKAAVGFVKLIKVALFPLFFIIQVSEQREYVLVIVLSGVWNCRARFRN